MITKQLAMLGWLMAAALGCSGEGAGPAEPAPAGTTGGGVNPLGRARCRAPQGVSASPQNTQEALALLNALPKPTSAACFVESLARPLNVQATSSLFSQQPALSVASPRVFLKLGQLWLSIVMDGDASYLIEFGDQISVDPPRSIKGEVQLPISDAIAPGAPYERVMYSPGTTQCGFCHYDERPVEDVAFAAFSSISFRPRPDTYVSLESLRGEQQRCDFQKEPHRCEMFDALFASGDVVETDFPPTMATFF
ncbi:MAG TPA: hypothetical protein VEQ58_23450 [Polyangiaceae bacterium]|nr:hypothetical protein [Polyangiaceae bacterium]